VSGLVTPHARNFPELRRHAACTAAATITPDGIVRCVKSSNPQLHPTGCPGAFAFDMSMPDRGD
jgi:hypothetical protein